MSRMGAGLSPRSTRVLLMATALLVLAPSVARSSTVATPTIATQATATATLGNSIDDRATVSGRVNPVAGATVMFKLYAPSDSLCTGTPVFSMIVAYPVAGGEVTSASFTPAQSGTYHWIAMYSGDANNSPVAGVCNDPSETSIVSFPPPPPPPPPPLLPPPPPPPPPPIGGDLVGNVTDSLGGSQTLRTRASGPQANAPIQACPVPQGNRACQATQTNGAGHFAFVSIPAGDYQLTANPPAGDTTHTQGTAGPVTVVLGQTTTRDVQLGFIQAVPPGSSVDSAIGTSNGVPVVHWTSPLALSTTACAAGAVSYSITIGGSVVSSGPMTRGAITGSDAAYSVTAPAAYPGHGIATVTFTISGCPSNTRIVFDIYIDPSGTVITERDGLPIAGATVRLLRSNGAFGPFTYVPDGSAIMSPSNRRNPDMTASNGAFGWDVIAGYYVVHASKAGCGPGAGDYLGAFPGTYPGTYPGSYPSEDPATTPVLQIPPPALNLTIRLDCGGPKATPSPTALTFPQTAVGATSAPKTFSIANTGAERLHLTLPLTASTGLAADFGVTSTCPAAIDPAGSCTATVTFAPKAPTGGTRSSKVVLAGDGDGPTASVTLGGSTPAPVTPPPPPPPVKPRLAAGCIKTITRVAANRVMTFRCRLSVVDGARLLRIASGRVGGASSTRFRLAHARTVRLAGGRATVRLRLTPAESRRVRRAGRRGVRVFVRVQALDGDRKPLLTQTKRTRLRRA